MDIVCPNSVAIRYPVGIFWYTVFMSSFLLIGLAIFVLIVVIAIWSTDTSEEALEIDAEETAEVTEEGPNVEPLPPKPQEEYLGGAGDSQ